VAEFDVIVCDVMMQEMDGCQLYRRIAAEYPGLERRVVFITGGTFTRELDDFLASLPEPAADQAVHLESILPRSTTSPGPLPHSPLLPGGGGSRRAANYPCRNT